MGKQQRDKKTIWHDANKVSYEDVILHEDILVKMRDGKWAVGEFKSVGEFHDYIGLNTKEKQYGYYEIEKFAYIKEIEI